LNEGARVWFITGASSGFGRAIAESALARGDSIAAAARRPRAVGELAEHDRGTRRSLTRSIASGASTSS
jgi:NAD(P)-dependent dehydrogenase (short-subunit alcohol dehydrogenase family)